MKFHVFGTSIQGEKNRYRTLFLRLYRANQTYTLTYLSYTLKISPQCDPAYTANMFMDLLSEQPDSLMVLGAACSDVTEILAEMSAYRNLAQVCYL